MTTTDQSFIYVRNRYRTGYWVYSGGDTIGTILRRSAGGWTPSGVNGLSLPGSFSTRGAAATALLNAEQPARPVDADPFRGLPS